VAPGWRVWVWVVGWEVEEGSEISKVTVRSLDQALWRSRRRRQLDVEMVERLRLLNCVAESLRLVGFW